MQNIKKGTSSVADFVLKVKTIGDSLEAAGQTVSENDLILSMLSGVGRDYDSVVSVVISQRNNISPQEVQYLLLNHEQRLAQFNSESQLDIPTASANFVSGNQSDKRSQRGGFNGSNFYNNGGRSGANRGRNRGRGGRWNGNNRPICQVCGKTGHVAMNCYHRFDRNFQSNNQNQSTQFNSQSAQFNGNNVAALTNGPQQANYHQSTAYYATPETL